MNKSFGRGLPRRLFGLALGITLVLGLIPGIRVRVALAEGPTYKITVSQGAQSQTVMDSGQLDTFYTYTGSLPKDFDKFNGVEDTELVKVDTEPLEAGAGYFDISFKCTSVCTDSEVKVNYNDTSSSPSSFSLSVSCVENTAVTVDPTTTTVDVKGTAKLTAVVTPEVSAQQGVTWTSDNTEIATVADDGTVTGVKAGKATITATSVADPTRTATCEIIVTEPVIPVTGVELDKKSAAIKAGETDKLVATIVPEGATDKTITWRSSDEKVATVKDGTVTGVKAGSATITVATNDGGKTATCEVTVTEPTPAVTYSADPASASWTQGSKDGLAFTFKRSDGSENDTTFDHFKAVFVDGKELKKDEDYTVVKGSVIVTLSPAYLNTLAVGDHTLTAAFDDGSATSGLAVVESTTYTIGFDANGGEGSMDSLVVDKGATIKLPKNVFTRPGYTFIGWNLAADGSDNSYTDEQEVSVLTSGTLYAQWKKADYSVPTMSNSRGGRFTSISEEITYTVYQGVPDYAKSFVTWVDLEDVLQFSSDEVAVRTSDGTPVGDGVAKVSMEGQRLTVTVDDASSLLGRTIEISYKAKLRDDADLGPYMNSDGTIASVPYQASTIFDGNENDVKSSTVEFVNFRVSGSHSPSPSPSSSPSRTSTASTSTKSSNTLAKTGDATSFVAVATMAVAGVSALVSGRRRRR